VVVLLADISPAFTQWVFSKYFCFCHFVSPFFEGVGSTFSSFRVNVCNSKYLIRLKSICHAANLEFTAELVEPDCGAGPELDFYFLAWN
jgi:hypothetical protein